MSAERILVIRPDRIGDVLLSTPVFEALKSSRPKSHLTVMVRAEIAPLIRGLSTVDEILIYEPNGIHRGIAGWWRLLKDFRRGNYRYGVVLQSVSRIAWALLFSGIRFRVGPLSKIHSYWVYNRGVRQRRSSVEMHEADYNLQLLRRLGVRAQTRSFLTRAQVSPVAQERQRKFLGEDAEIRQWVAIHPGMGGSALNWPEEHYLDLAKRLVQEPGVGVVISTGPQEGELKKRFESALISQKPRFRFFQGSQLEDLVGLFSLMDLVVAPSTGPLHLAVALERRVVTFYPAIRVQSAVRWGPYVADDQRASVLVPDAYCGQEFKCRGPTCHAFPCMPSLSVTQALEQVRIQLDAARTGK